MSEHRSSPARSHRAALSVLTLVALALAATGCDAAGSAPRRAVLANVHPAGYPTAEALQELARGVAADPLLGSRVRIDLQLAGVLGNEKEILEKLHFGGVQMACVSAAPLAEFSSAIGVLSLPYLFRDGEHMWRVLDGEIGDELLDSLRDAGFLGLAWFDAGARSFYTREKPIDRPEDLVGLKIRVQKSEIMHQTVEILGAAPVTLGFKQVYSALHTGAIDGAENNLPSYRSQRHYEAAPHYSWDRHAAIPDLLLVNVGFWETLEPEVQAALQAAAAEASTNQRRLWDLYESATRDELAAAGVELHEVADPAAFEQAVAPIYDRWAASWPGVVERVRAAAP